MLCKSIQGHFSDALCRRSDFIILTNIQSCHYKLVAFGCI